MSLSWADQADDEAELDTRDIPEKPAPKPAKPMVSAWGAPKAAAPAVNLREQLKKEEAQERGGRAPLGGGSGPPGFRSQPPSRGGSSFDGPPRRGDGPGYGDRGPRGGRYEARGGFGDRGGYDDRPPRGGGFGRDDRGPRDGGDRYGRGGGGRYEDGGASRGRSNQICFKFQDGDCNRGESCRFSHDPNAERGGRSGGYDRYGGGAGDTGAWRTSARPRDDEFPARGGGGMRSGGGFRGGFRGPEVLPRTEEELTEMESRIPSTGPFTAFVGNLPFRRCEDDLANLLGPEIEKKIDDIRLVEREGVLKGFGYVVFSSPDALKQALTFHGKELDGRPIKVDVAEAPRRPVGRFGGAREAGGPSAGPPQERRRLQLKPVTKKKAEAVAPALVPRSQAGDDPFGGARPRDLVLAERKKKGIVPPKARPARSEGPRDDGGRGSGGRGRDTRDTRGGGGRGWRSGGGDVGGPSPNRTWGRGGRSRDSSPRKERQPSTTARKTGGAKQAPAKKAGKGAREESARTVAANAFSALSLEEDEE